MAARTASQTDVHEPDFGNVFVAAYPPFGSWTAAEVAGLAPHLERRPPPVPLGLYVHIPFCVERCQYCYYLAYDDRPEARGGYPSALAAELELYLPHPLLAGRPLNFVYIGGGTPSSLNVQGIERLLALLQERLPWSAAREVTFECAPRTLTESKARALKAGGVTRISLGVQALDDEVLAESGRVHKVADVRRAWDILRRVGFPLVNVDLIVGLPGESEAGFLRGLEGVIALAPDNVTLYQLEIPANTPLHRRLTGGLPPAPIPSWPEKHARLTRGFELLGAAGYGLRSAYTAYRASEHRPFLYQDEQYAGADVLGLGVSAFSYLDGMHFQNVSRLEPYLLSLAREVAPVARARRLSPEERLVRRLVLQLKLLRVPLEPLRAEFGAHALAPFAATLEGFAASGWLELDDEALTLTPAGVPRVDRMLPELYLAAHRGA